MVFSISHDSSSAIYLPPRKELDSTNQKITQFVSQKLQEFCIRASMGVAIGALALSFDIFLQDALNLIPGMAEYGADEKLATEFFEEVQGNFWEVAAVGPVLEEVIFRFVLQGIFKLVAAKICPDVEIEIFSSKIKLAALVAVVATATLFGLTHIANGLGLSYVLGVTIAGVILGILKEQYGLTASITAHMTNNAIAYGLLSL